VITNLKSDKWDLYSDKWDLRSDKWDFKVECLKNVSENARNEPLEAKKYEIFRIWTPRFPEKFCLLRFPIT
jgi:hypothetical protein